jgi:hypothetical protein
MARSEGRTLEPERSCQKLAAESVLLELRGESVDARDLVVEIVVADDHPLEAERIGLAVDVRA